MPVQRLRDRCYTVTRGHGRKEATTLEPPGTDPDDDPNATRVIRPRPTGRRTTPAGPPPDAVPLPRPAVAAPVDVAATLSGGAGPAGSLLPFAMPALQLLGRLRTLPVEPDPAALRDRTEAELRAFEARALAAGVTPDLVRRAQYALCDSLDDVVLNTPWGARSAWARQSMVATFHPGIGPGRFFDALRQAESQPVPLRPVLELMVLCLSLGGLGPYRDRPGGAEQVEALRSTAVAALLAQEPPPPAGLSECWKGVDAPFRRHRRVRLPVWVAASAALAAAGAVFLVVSSRVNAAGDALFASMLAAPPSHMPQIARDPVPPPPPAPPDAAHPTAQDRVRGRLAGAAAGTVAGTPGAPVVRLPETALFPTGSATLTPGAMPLLDAVAGALKPEAGRLHVLGFADDRPVRTVLFPSAFKLTAARAEAVRAALLRALGPGATITADGRGAADPIAANATAEGREQNRRIEIVLDGTPP